MGWAIHAAEAHPRSTREDCTNLIDITQLLYWGEQRQDGGAMEITERETEPIRRLRKLLRNSSGGLIAAGGIVYGLTQVPSGIPLGLTPEQLKKGGVYLILFGLGIGVLWALLELIAIWRLSAIRPVAWLKQRRLRSPIYSRPLEDARLGDIRTAAQGEMWGRMAVVEREAKALSEAATKNAEDQRRRKIKIVKKQQAEIVQLKRELLRAAYGREEMPEPKPIDPVALPVIVNGLHGLIRSWKKLLTAAEPVWDDLRVQAIRHGETSPSGFLSAYLKSVEYRRMHMAAIELQSTLNRKDDPGPLILLAYYMYREWRQVLGQLAATMGRQLNEVSGYESWRAEEIAFVSQLEEKLAPPELSGLWDLIESYDKQHGALSAPPPSLTTAELGEYGERVRALLLATQDENRFFDLFCTNELEHLKESSTLLPREVWKAGEELARKGILVSREIEKSVIRFCMPETTTRAWKNSGRPKREYECINIDLRFVQGTGASGGGTGGIMWSST